MNLSKIITRNYKYLSRWRGKKTNPIKAKTNPISEIAFPFNGGRLLISAVFTVCLFGCLFVISGCQKKPGSGDAALLPDNLALSALQTHIQYIKAVNSGAQEPSDEIPKKYWTNEIKRLNPIKVYRHRSNIVVVQRASTNREEGLYISIMISSYAPRSGDDGFTFTDIGNSVYDFKRVIEN